jgi:hypothetical protein
MTIARKWPGKRFLVGAVTARRRQKGADLTVFLISDLRRRDALSLPMSRLTTGPIIALRHKTHPLPTGAASCPPGASMIAISIKDKPGTAVNHASDPSVPTGPKLRWPDFMDKVGQKREPQAGAYALGFAEPIEWAKWSSIITRLLCNRCMNIDCATEAMLTNHDM